MLRLVNADGKEWILPFHHLRTALLLYQPSGWRGRWLKRFLPWIGSWSLVQRLLHFEVMEVRLSPTVEEAVAKAFDKRTIVKAFDKKDFEFALFGGTPCVHQKVTIQVFDGDQILGYVKVADQTAVAENFKREANLLLYLKEKGLTGIPDVLACDETSDRLHYFVQTTKKSLQSTYPHEWTAKHEAFINALHDATKVELHYEETDLYALLQGLKAKMGWLKEHQRHIVESALAEVEPSLRTTKEWSVYHADFTPWNMFLEGGDLFVFDWEYALRACLPGLDRYHFLTQTLIFEERCNAEEILSFFRKKIGISKKYHYLCYLLTNIAIYIGRESDPSGVAHIQMMDTWMTLLDRLNEEYGKDSLLSPAQRP